MAATTATMKRVKHQDAVYIIEAYNSDGSEPEGFIEEVMKGGGICIDPDGLIVTVAHIIPLNYKTVTVRARSVTDFDRADVLNMNRSFDICFLLIRKSTETQTFSYMNIDDFRGVREGDEVFSWINHNIGFALTQGRVSFPYDSVVFPPFSCKRTIRDDPSVLNEKRKLAFTTTLPFRTVGGITRQEDLEFYDYHPDMPLIEIHGIFGKPGASGCPVFTSKEGTVIGLLMIDHSGRNYLLPSDFILGYMEQFKISGLKGKISSLNGKGESVGSANSSDQKLGKLIKSAQSVPVKHSDGLPDGYDKPEELLEVMTMAQLGIHGKPVGLLDVDGYYNSLLSFIDKAVEEGFISPDVREKIVSMPTTREMVKKLGEYVQLGDGAEQLGYPRAYNI